MTNKPTSQRSSVLENGERAVEDSAVVDGLNAELEPTTRLVLVDELIGIAPARSAHFLLQSGKKEQKKTQHLYILALVRPAEEHRNAYKGVTFWSSRRKLWVLSDIAMYNVSVRFPFESTAR